MNAFVAILSPLALLLPALAGEWPAPRDDLSVQEAAGRKAVPQGFDALPSEPFDALRQARGPLEYGQVRIEQRVIIRISPSACAPRWRTSPAWSRRRSRTGSYCSCATGGS